MSERTMPWWVRTVVRFTALVLCASVLISHLQQTAQLPLVFLGKPVRYLTSSRAVAGIPLEFWLAVWFLVVSARKITAGLISVEFVRFWSGIAVSAVCLGALYRVGLQCLPLTTAFLAAAVVIIDSGGRLRRPSGLEQVTLGAAVHHDWSVVRQPQRLIGVIAATALALLVAQYLSFSAAATTPADRDAELARWFESEPQVPSNDLVAPGKIRIVAFSDYLCPACSLQVPELERTVRRYQNGGYANIEWIVRDFPLDADCNPGVTTRIHQLACRTAVAARVAGKFLETSEAQGFRDRIYRRHGAITETDLMRELETARLLQTFNETYEEEVKAVRDDAVLGSTLGVVGTPTVFVDGRLLRDAQPRVLAAILAHMVRASEKHSPAMAGR